MKKNSWPVYRYLKMFLFIGVVSFKSFEGLSQPIVTIFPDTTYGNGTRKTTVVNDGSGIKTTTIEIFDGSTPPKLRERVVVSKNLVTGDSTTHRIVYENSYAEQKVVESWLIVDSATKKTSFERKLYNADGSLYYGDKTTTLPGSNPIREVFDPKTGKYVEVADTGSPGKNNSYCAYPKFQVSAAYSYARVEGGANGLGFPLGVNVAGTYNFSPHLGLTLDASFHYRKKDDQKWDRQYVLGGIEYECNDCYCDCDEDDPHTMPKLFGHLLISYAKDGYQVMGFKNSGSGFAAAISGGIKFNINDNAAIKLKTDAIPVFFENNTTIDYRVGLGIELGIGKKHSLQKDPYLHYKPSSSD